MKIKFYQLCVRGQNYNVINTFEKTHILKEMIFLLKKKSLNTHYTYYNFFLEILIISYVDIKILMSAMDVNVIPLIYI